MKASIISIVPFKVVRQMPGMFPSYLEIEPGSPEEPRILVVDDGKYYRYVLDGQSVQLPEFGPQIAKSFVNDYITAQLGRSDDAYPGLFWIEGVVQAADLKSKYKKELDSCKAAQDKWFRNLVKMADDDWQRHHQYKVISDLQRHAARSLNLVREWIDVVAEDRKNCPACGIELKLLTPICFNCKAILDPVAAKSIQFAGA